MYFLCLFLQWLLSTKPSLYEGEMSLQCVSQVIKVGKCCSITYSDAVWGFENSLIILRLKKPKTKTWPKEPSKLYNGKKMLESLMLLNVA